MFICISSTVCRVMCWPVTGVETGEGRDWRRPRSRDGATPCVGEDSPEPVLGCHALWGGPNLHLDPLGPGGEADSLDNNHLGDVLCSHGKTKSSFFKEIFGMKDQFFVNCRAPRFQPLMFTGALCRCRSRKQTGDIAALVFLTSSFPAGFRRDVGSNQRPPFRGS